VDSDDKIEMGYFVRGYESCKREYKETLEGAAIRTSGEKLSRSIRVSNFTKIYMPRVSNLL